MGTGKKIMIILIIISIGFNIFLAYHLSKAYQRIDKYLTSSYVKVTTTLEDVENKLNKENGALSIKETKILADELFFDTAYNYAMQTNTFKWLNSHYEKFSLDIFAMYIATINEDSKKQNLSSTEANKICSSLMNICKLWKTSGIKKTILDSKNHYDFYHDNKNIIQMVEKVNKYCKERYYTSL